VVVNDVHSKLTRTRVRSVAIPRDLEELRLVVRSAVSRGHRVSIAGARHSMGGQPFGERTVLIDTRSLDRVLDFDGVDGRVRVEGGIQWPALLDFLEGAQRNERECWTIHQKQTGADRLTLAGALSCNAHGRGLALPPIVGQVEAFDLLTPDGEVVQCSRTERPELFSLAIGGYGLFGVITAVDLRLRPRCKLRRTVSITDAAGLMERVADRVRDGYEYGDFQFSIDPADDAFLNQGVFSCYVPVGANIPLTEDPVRFSPEDWLSLAVEAHRDKKRAFQLYARKYLRTDGQVYWSDDQLRGPYPAEYHKHVTRALGTKLDGSEMITELFVPRGRFEAFMRDTREVLRRRKADVIYGTVRLIEPDRETFLAWASRPWACTVLNLHVDHTSDAVAAAADTFRELIDVAIRNEGSYYLAYHRWARSDQVERCYPQIRAFLDAKRRYDPAERLQSDWYHWYRRMFGG
jgi:FAD/FMN-containing dehydrogenase